MSAAAQPQALIGRWIGAGYQLQKFIGAGAFAWVYYAVNTYGQPVAIKILQVDSVEARTLFSREVKVLRQLPRSPYCVAYVDDGLTDDGRPFMAMEFIDGATLKDAFKFKPTWTVEEACGLMSQMCDALAGLHKLGLAHRDLKPENVMLTRDWQVKLMDFGLVKDAQGLLKLFETEDILSGRDFAENVDKAMLAGTPEYMAPEQFSDPMVEDESMVKTDTWSDVYSLGLIFYQLLTGAKLFPVRLETGNQQAYARGLLNYIRQRTTFSDLNLRRPEAIPTGLWPVIAVALRQNPRHRQHTATELGIAIRKFMETGSSDDFGEEEHTSMADFAGLASMMASRAAAQAHPQAPPEAPNDFERTMVVDSSQMQEITGVNRSAPNPWASDRTNPDGTAPATSAFGPVPRTPPPVDVGAIQAYREQQLNRPGGGGTIPPGVYSSGVMPAPVMPAHAGTPSAGYAAMQPGQAAYAMQQQQAAYPGYPQQGYPPQAQQGYPMQPPPLAEPIPLRAKKRSLAWLWILLVLILGAAGGGGFYLVRVRHIGSLQQLMSLFRR